MTERKALLILVILACALPAIMAVVLAVGRLLAAMEDMAGAAVLDRIGLAIGVIWAVNLVGLVVLMAVHILNASTPDE